MKKIDAENFSKRDKRLRGEAIEVTCSNCNCPIGEIWKLEEKTKVKQIRFHCGQCEDYSFTTSIDCKFYVGSTEYCAISSANETGELINIETVRLKDYE